MDLATRVVKKGDHLNGGQHVSHGIGLSDHACNLMGEESHSNLFTVILNSISALQILSHSKIQ